MDASIARLMRQLKFVITSGAMSKQVGVRVLVSEKQMSLKNKLTRDYEKENARRRELYAADPIIREQKKLAQRERRARIPDKMREHNTHWQRKKRGEPEPTRPCPALCEICFRPPSKRTTTLSVDREHLTNTFRGWLCSSCNLGLGNFGDSVERLERAVAYLRRSM